MKTLRELIPRLTTLTPEELAYVHAQILVEAERLDTDEATVQDIAVLQELAGFGELVMAEAQKREAVAAQAQSDRRDARQRIAVLNPPAAGLASVPVAASGNQVVRMAARQGHTRPSPEAPDPTRNSAVLTTARAAAMAETLSRPPRHGNLRDTEQVPGPTPPPGRRTNRPRRSSKHVGATARLKTATRFVGTLAALTEAIARLLKGVGGL